VGTLLTPCSGDLATGYPAIIGNPYGDDRGNLFIGVNSCLPGVSGLWKVEIDTGAMSLVASAPEDTPNVLLNGVVVFGDTVLVTDSLHDLVWRAPVHGTGQPLEVWNDDPLLTAPPGPYPGPNGIAIFHHDAYVAVSATAQIIKIPIRHDGRAGRASVHAQLSKGCDDFSFDVHGNIYCTTDPSETVTRISQDGVETVLLTAADGLDGPTATYFGWGPERRTLFITNGDVPFFPGTGFGPSLLKVDVGVRGYHLPEDDDDE
jgi:sugar lactone lactonase YvrE